MAARRFGAGLVRRVGRRGAVLLWLAILDLIYGLSLAHPPPEAARSASTQFFAHLMPLPAWGALWLGTGVVCLIGAFQRRDRWAYACATALKVLWGAVCLLGWMLAGLSRGWVSAAIFLPMAVLVLVISTWPEPPVTERIVEADEVHLGGAP